ncbi:gamma-glutamylcyclotransferase [Vibrio sp. SCSIO 43136]|uniref:gamma-glutamylcyclotransferase family protein n=1 Tax=Vibrio sp. SCSIO 43136 TaxID=2819101 RepID=UPI002075225A|nr:gamma-glutamylcyclotransferase [Vibrio sp. SCSIO 43136]USD64979.1 gamma-glutamylcyclotransferase [Vibrio sp. SCSIO 43136]
MEHLVFVYGTLRQGEPNHHFLEGCELVAQHRTAPSYALYDLGPYPGLIEGQQEVNGEIYRISPEVLVRLDHLEDVPYEYRREKIDTPYGEAWIYLYQDKNALSERIDSGDWCQRF